MTPFTLNYLLEGSVSKCSHTGDRGFNLSIGAGRKGGVRGEGGEHLQSITLSKGKENLGLHNNLCMDT